MKKIAILVSIVVGFVFNGYCQEGLSAQVSGGNNFVRFTDDKVTITHELDSLTSQEFKTHPEYGVRPFNAPCQDCMEILQKRDETHRYFVKEGSKGKEFYLQTAYSPLNFYDGSGVLRTIDYRMKPSGQQGVFRASHQPFPVTINIPERFTSLLNRGKELQVNRDVNIYIKHNDGSITSLGEPDWSNYTAGDDGIVVHNFYPGIDLELSAGSGNIESFYRLNKPLHLEDGWLVIRDNIKLPQGFVYDYSHSEKMSVLDPSSGKENDYYAGSLHINDQAGTQYFSIGNPSAYDENNQDDNRISLNYQIADNGAYDFYVPIGWMNDAKRSYPIIIDPIVTSTNFVPPANINSSYNATCFVQGTGCQTNLIVNVPPGCIITDIPTTFWFDAFNPCGIRDGAWDILYNGCRFPQAGTWETCGLPIPGACQLSGLSCFSQFQSCLPAPSCNPGPMTFILELYRCNQPGANCAGSCIGGDILKDTPWSVTLTAHTVDVATQDDSVCQGSSVTLTANATWGVGVPQYTYSWAPAPNSQAGNTAVVSPAMTTQYTVTVTSCGNTATATSNVKVFPNDNPGFTINPITPCTGSLVAISGNPTNPAAPATSYDWLTPGGNPASQNDQQNINVTYNNAGMDNITLAWTSPTSGCPFDSTQQITVIQSAPRSVTISVPSNSVCAGDNVTFTANPVNQGAGSTYDWYVYNGNKGAPNQSGPGTTFSSATLQNGDSVMVVLNDPTVLCGTTAFASNVIVMTINPILTPNVLIKINPMGTLCPGLNVTFTADTTNGGQNPTYQWQVNAGNVGTGQTYSTNTLNNGDNVTVTMTSSAPCPVPPTASANLTVQVYPVVTVTTSGDATICPGQPTMICAVAAGGDNGPYFYSWNNGGGMGNCVTVSPLTTGANVYTVSATDACNTPATGPVTTVTLTVAQAPTPNFTYSPSDISILTPTVHFTDQSTNGTPVSWDFGDTICGNNAGVGTNPSHTYCQPGTYTVKLVETNISGCLDSITYTLEIHDEYYFYIPNSFTPNNDGINDFFAPQGSDALLSLPLVYTMTIYNRWGEKIFETDNTSLPWAGQANNGSKVAPAGVYVYRIQFQDSHYSDKVMVGSVTLVR